MEISKIFFGVYGNSRVRKQSRRNTVTFGKSSREAAVIHLPLAAGGASRFQNCNGARICSRYLKRALGAVPIILGDVASVSHQHALAYDLRWNSRCGKPAENLGADGYEIIFFRKRQNAFIWLAPAVIAA